MDIDPNELPLGFLLNTVGRLIFEETRCRIDGIGIDVIELGILWLVEMCPGQLQADYARYQRRDGTTFGRYVDKLEEKGFLARASIPGDRRAKALNVTEAGKALLSQAKTCVAEAESSIVDPHAADVAQLRAFLHHCLTRQESR